MMLKIHDDRADNEKQLHDIEPNAFFMYDDVLCRRVCSDKDIRLHYDTDDIPVVEQATGNLTLIDRNAWVTPCWCELHIKEG